MPTSNARSNLPMAIIGPDETGEPAVEGFAPDGFLTSREVFKHVLALWWGVRADYWTGGELGGQEFVPDEGIRALETHHHWRDTVHRIRDAAVSGEIELLFECESGLRRVTPDQWWIPSDEWWENSLVLGEISPIGPEPFRRFDGALLLFETERAERWLRGLKSPHVLPDPLRRDPDPLPDTPYVPLTEAMTWLANGTPKSSSEMLLGGAGSTDAKVRVWFEHHPSNFAPEELAAEIAEYMAETVRLNTVERALRSAIAEAEIEAHGKRGEIIGSAQIERSPIPREVFLENVQLSYQFGGVVVAGAAQDVDVLETARVAQWSNVRFFRHDLVRLWGASAERKPSSSSHRQPTRSGQKSTGRRRKRDLAGDAYHALYPRGHEAERHESGRALLWEEARRAVSEQIGEVISIDTLKRGVGQKR